MYTPDLPLSPTARGKHIFCFGFGYTASFLAPQLLRAGWKASGTTTSRAKKSALGKQGIDACLFDHNNTLLNPFQTFQDVTHLLLSIPPDNGGDLVFNMHSNDLAAMKNLEWAGYLSTTAVYGVQNGSWVDEATPPAPANRRGSLRLHAEEEWQSLLFSDGFPLHIFRLSGIYGPGRSALDTARSGAAQRIDKPGHAFNRIHIDDIVQTLIASMNRPNPGAIYNLADDQPSPSQDVVTYACELTGAALPPLIPFDDAELAPMVRSFYKENKRVKNARIKDELGVHLLHPDYREGLKACLKVEKDAMELVRLSLGILSS